jgi:hypothetical protein
VEVFNNVRLPFTYSLSFRFFSGFGALVRVDHAVKHPPHDVAQQSWRISHHPPVWVIVGLRL